MTVEQLQRVLRSLPPQAEVLLANDTASTAAGFTSATRVSLIQVCRVTDVAEDEVQFVKPNQWDWGEGRRGSSAAVIGGFRASSRS